MVQIKTPDLGGIQEIVESVLYCQAHGMEAYQGGTCNETDVSAQCCVHLAMATRPGADAGQAGHGIRRGLHDRQERNAADLRECLARDRPISGGAARLASHERVPRPVAVGDPGLRLSGGVVSAGRRTPAALDRLRCRLHRPGPVLPRQRQVVHRPCAGQARPAVHAGGRPAHRRAGRGRLGGRIAGPRRTWRGAGRLSRRSRAKSPCRSAWAIISSDVDKGRAEAARGGRAGRDRCPSCPPLTEEAIDASTHLVAQIGCEPLIRAIQAGCQVVLAGRCYDPANFAALPILLRLRRRLGTAHGQDPRMRGDRRHARQRRGLRAGHAHARHVRPRSAQPAAPLHVRVGRRPYAVRKVRSRTTCPAPAA